MKYIEYGNQGVWLSTKLHDMLLELISDGREEGEVADAALRLLCSTMKSLLGGRSLILFLGEPDE